MAENIPPSTSSAQNPSTTATTAATTTATTTATPSAARADDRGRPYYESLRTSLRATLEKKRKLDEQLAALEDTIFKTEGAYLEETAGSGNIVRGFDGWVKGVQVSGRSNTGGAGGLGGGGGGGEDRRRGGGPVGTGAASGRVRDDDRVFSRSSVGWMKQQAQDGTDSNTASNAPTPSAGPGASREGPTPTTAGTKAPNKKKRPTEKDEDEDSKSSKRGKITYARD